MAIVKNEPKVFTPGKGKSSTPAVINIGYGITDAPNDPKKIPGYIDGLANTNPEAFNAMANALKRVGIPVRKFTDVGVAMSGFVAKLKQDSNPALRGITLETFLASVPAKDAFATQKKKKPTAQYFLTTEPNAAAEINNEFSKVLGISATPEEQKAYYKELIAEQKKAPMVTSTVDGIVTQTAGFSAAQKEALLTKFVAARAARAMGKAEMVGGTRVDVAAPEQFTGEFLKNINAIRAYSNSFGVPMSDYEVKKAAIAAITSPGGLEAQAEQIKGIAKGIYSGLAPFIDQGLTPEKLLQPYIAKKAQILEIPEEQITLNSTEGQQIVSKVVTDKGLLPIYNYERELRADPRWRFTKNANDEAANWVNSIMRSFGVAG
jgi:hypothetical protein